MKERSWGDLGILGPLGVGPWRKRLGCLGVSENIWFSWTGESGGHSHIPSLSSTSLIVVSFLLPCSLWGWASYCELLSVSPGWVPDFLWQTTRFEVSKWWWSPTCSHVLAAVSSQKSHIETTEKPLKCFLKCYNMHRDRPHTKRSRKTTENKVDSLKGPPTGMFKSERKKLCNQSVLGKRDWRLAVKWNSSWESRKHHKTYIQGRRRRLWDSNGMIVCFYIIYKQSSC